METFAPEPASVRTGMQVEDTPPVSLGYASCLPQERPPRSMSTALVALGMGLLLLCMACYVLISLVGWLMSGALTGSQRELLVLMAGVFGVFCTLLATVFFFVGLKWLGGIDRSGG